jgi:hypothetical protein
VSRCVNFVGDLLNTRSVFFFVPDREFLLIRVRDEGGVHLVKIKIQ